MKDVLRFVGLTVASAVIFWVVNHALDSMADAAKRTASLPPRETVPDNVRSIARG